MDNLQINGPRLWDSLMETAKFGGTAKGGICRLTLTDFDRQVRDWFVAQCEAAGCTVTIDTLGNILAQRPGRDNSLPAIAIGSHLDTQPSGGKFDGILGVLGGLEVLRTLQDTGYETHAPITVIDWTNEEGSRFAPAMLSSGVFAGVFDADYANSRQDRDGKKFGDELDRIGYRGTVPVGSQRLGAYFELHIEQGPILEDENKEIGIVTGVQGMRWFEVTITGRDSHAGTTPMHLRRDALLGTARMIEAIHALALVEKPLAVSTVGLVEVTPNSRNVIPGSVFFTVDLRHPDDAVLARMEQQLRDDIARIAAASGLESTVEQVWDSPAVHYDAACVGAVREAADHFGFSHRDIISGAGHDAAYMARVTPTAMIFVPCRDGISHNEIEYSAPEQVAAGTNVLLRAVIEHDRKEHERRQVRAVS
ncbi:MAG: Zn-dependent hydrolase [Azospirillaceae bacterium]|nr:Zn-dependent hydrolase [Azospirillaceae bacterium]